MCIRFKRILLKYTKKFDKELRTKLKEVIAMKKRGINHFFTDADMILEVMNRLEYVVNFRT